MDIGAYSKQGQKITSRNYEMLRPHEHYGRRRVHFFELDTTAAIASGSVIAVAKLPAGARILNGKVCNVAGTWGLKAFDNSGLLDGPSIPGGNKTGVSEDTVAGSLGTTTAGATAVPFAHAANADATRPQYGYITKKEVWLTVTTTAVIAAGAVAKGDIEIVVD